jgi:hypothetical protein
MAYPNGTDEYVTDAAPFCAGCHSSRQESQLRETPEGEAGREAVEVKHFAAIVNRTPPYDTLSSIDRARLLSQLRAVDLATTITLDAPKAVKAGATVTVIAKAHGGAGPVVGIMLLDSDLRYQSRSPAADGWMITGVPAVTGPEGKAQTKWTDKRAAGLAKNLNYVMVYGMKGDVLANTYDDATVTYTLQAPTKPGDYTLAAALLYGTEKASPLTTVKKDGVKLPLGGFTGGSGRVLFSDARTVKVTK